MTKSLVNIKTYYVECFKEIDNLSVKDSIIKYILENLADRHITKFVQDLALEFLYLMKEFNGDISNFYLSQNVKKENNKNGDSIICLSDDEIQSEKINNEQELKGKSKRQIELEDTVKIILKNMKKEQYSQIETSENQNGADLNQQETAAQQETDINNLLKNQLLKNRSNNQENNEANDKTENGNNNPTDLLSKLYNRPNKKSVHDIVIDGRSIDRKSLELTAMMSNKWFEAIDLEATEDNLPYLKYGFNKIWDAWFWHYKRKDCGKTWTVKPGRMSIPQAKLEAIQFGQENLIENEVLFMNRKLFKDCISKLRSRLDSNNNENENSRKRKNND